MMRPCVLLVLLTGFGLAPASAADLKTADGKAMSGKLVSINDKEVVLAVGDRMVTTPLASVMILDLAPVVKAPAETPVTLIDLVDGTTLMVKEYKLVKDQITYAPLDGTAENTIPVASVSSILNATQDDKLRKQWGEMLSNKRDRDIFAVYREGVLNPLKGVIGEGIAPGDKIEFTLGTTKRELPLANAAGLVFFRTINPLAPPINLKLLDTAGNLYMVNAWTLEGETVVATTSSTVVFKLPLARVAKFDYSKGKQTFLSDMTPSRMESKSASGSSTPRLYLDRNLKSTLDSPNPLPMRLNGEAYTRGLAMFTYTELEYDLKGAYLEFRAIAGIDDEVNSAERGVHLLIEADGKELLSLTFNRQDKVRAQPISLNVKDVNKLRIVVSDTAQPALDIGTHLNLANAQVTK